MFVRLPKQPVFVALRVDRHGDLGGVDDKHLLIAIRHVDGVIRIVPFDLTPRIAAGIDGVLRIGERALERIAAAKSALDRKERFAVIAPARREGAAERLAFVSYGILIERHADRALFDRKLFCKPVSRELIVCCSLAVYRNAGNFCRIVAGISRFAFEREGENVAIDSARCRCRGRLRRAVIGKARLAPPRYADLDLFDRK